MRYCCRHCSSSQDCRGSSRLNLLSALLRHHTRAVGCYCSRADKLHTTAPVRADLWLHDSVARQGPHCSDHVAVGAPFLPSSSSSSFSPHPPGACMAMLRTLSVLLSLLVPAHTTRSPDCGGILTPSGLRYRKCRPTPPMPAPSTPNAGTTI